MSKRKLSRQGTLTDYAGFVEKFKPKKTTDDCLTPPEVFEAVADYACRRYGIDRSAVVRPFWPGGDYESHEYPEGCVVVDNPPFSIISRIVRRFNTAGIRFFLFAPHLTASGIPDVAVVLVGADVRYQNGAIVKTSFVTNMEPGIAIRNDIGLSEAIAEAVKKPDKPTLPKRSYDPHIFRATDLDPMTRAGVQFEIRSDECVKVGRAGGYESFGKWYLLSTAAAARAAAARAAAARAAAAREAAAREAAAREAEQVALSPQERLVVEELDKQAETETA